MCVWGEGAEQLVSRATVAPKVKAEEESEGEKIRVGLESREVKCCGDSMESLRELRQEQKKNIQRQK